MTRFGCGGYAIGTGISHSLFDGPAAYDFLSAWAANSAIFKDNNKMQTITPIHERGRLLTGTVANRCSGTVAVAAAIDHLYKLIMQSAMGNEEVGRKEYVCRTFRVSKEMIERLKMNALGETNGAAFSCSSFDLIAAHLWKVYT